MTIPPSRLANDLSISARVLHLIDRDVMWIEASWAQLQVLPFTAVPVAEIRRPEFVDSIEDLTVEEQAEYVEDLVERVEPAEATAPAVCHLDTGVARTHVLLEDSLAPQDLHTVIGTRWLVLNGCLWGLVWSLPAAVSRLYAWS